MNTQSQKSVRRDYLVACGMALFSSVLAIVLVPNEALGQLGRGGMIAVSLAVLALFGYVVFRTRAADDDEGGPSVDRLRKMSLLWLGLAVVMGVGMAKGAVASWFAGGADALETRSWVSLGVGGLTLIVALSMFVKALRSRSSHDSE